MHPIYGKARRRPGTWTPIVHVAVPCVCQPIDRIGEDHAARNLFRGQQYSKGRHLTPHQRAKFEEPA